MHGLWITFCLFWTIYCSSIPKFEISFSDYRQHPFIAPNLRTPMYITLFWDNIYNCTIYPNITSFTHQCSMKHNNTNIIASPSVSTNTTPKIEVSFNSTARILINNLKIYINDKEYYEINEFCVPEQYEFLQYDITQIRKDQCTNQLIPGKHLRQYNNLFIGQASHIIHHTLVLPEPLNLSNVEAFVIPPPVKQISIHVAPKMFKKGNPQTKSPVQISLWWYNKFYQCTVHPLKINTTYKCVVETDNVSTCDISDMNHKHFGRYVLLLEKEATSNDALEIDRITVTDITGTFYGIEHFCVSDDDKQKSNICHFQYMRKCNGYLGTHLGPANPQVFIDCNRSCIDADNCGFNKLFFYFVNNLYRLKNRYSQSRIHPTINGKTEHCPRVNRSNVSILPPQTTDPASFNLSHPLFSASESNMSNPYNLTALEHKVQDLETNEKQESKSTKSIDDHINLIWEVLIGVVFGLIFILLFMVKIYVELKNRSLPLNNPIIEEPCGGDITDTTDITNVTDYNSHLDSSAQISDENNIEKDWFFVEKSAHINIDKNDIDSEYVHI